MTLVLGDVSIARAIEQNASIKPMAMFKTLSPEVLEENRSWLEPHYLNPTTGKLVICIQSWIVRTPHHTILVDTCVGNNKPRAERDWNLRRDDSYAKSLAAAGLRPEDIDIVMCTHLHVDHVGWNTRLENGRWVPTFPNARYLFADRELTYWQQRLKEEPADVPWIADSVLPIIEAGRAEIVKSDHALDDRVRLLPTPGHTIDHFSIEIGKPGDDALITGDMIHSPLQIRHPELATFVDYDPVQSTATRRAVFGRCCDRGTRICGTHFATPAIGRLKPRRDAFDFVCE